MADDFNILFEYMRRFDERQARFEETLTSFGRKLTSLDRHLAADRFDATLQTEEIDSLKARIDRIERRLDLHDPQH